MRRLGSVVLAALALVPLARATPQLDVAATSGTTVVAFTIPPADAAPAKVSIFADAALPSLDLSAPPGSVLGTVTARVSAGALQGAIVPLAGTVEVAGAAGTYLSGTTPVAVSTAATNCTGAPAHTTYWVLKLAAAGQTLQVPLFVDAITAGSIAKATITLCLPSPYLPPPQGAPYGVKMLSAALTLKGVFPTSAGDYRWRALVTSYTPGTATPAATPVETQALEHAPAAVTIAGARAGKGKVAVSGKVTENGKPVARATVLVSGGSRPLRLRTGAAGTYRGVVAAAAAARFRATATVAARDLGAAGCTATFAAVSIPCVKAVDSAFTATSAAARAR